MPIINVTVNGGGRSSIAHPHAVIVGETGKRVVLPLAAKARHDNLAMKFSTAERVGDYPLTAKVGNPTPTIGLEIPLVGRDAGGKLSRDVSVEPILQQLRAFSKTGERIQFLNLGASAGGWYEITSMTFGGDEQQEAGTNNIVATVVSLSVQKASNQAGNIGPLTGGAISVDPKARTVTIQPNESLYAAAFRATGDGRNWPTIADANGITDPYNLVPGTTLRVPRAA